MRRPLPALAVVALTAWLVTTGAVPAAPATAGAAGPASFTVNSLNDAVADFASDPNHDICRTNVANTTCTLRAAIMNANRHAGGATIHLPAGQYPLQIPASGNDDDRSGDLDISNTVTIIGAAAGLTAIDAGGLYEHFAIYNPGKLTLSGLTLQNGKHTNGLYGGAIMNFGWLSLTNSVLSHNHAADGGALYVGNTAAATLNQVTVTHNDDDGIENHGTLTVTNSTIDNNGGSASQGGGILNFGALTLFNSTLSNNSAVHAGGGLYNSGTAQIFASTIAGNLADNQAAGGSFGGGIYNSAPANAVQIWNSLLADNFASHFLDQCQGGTLRSQDYNLIELNGSCALTGTVTHNVMPIHARLGPPADNGGPTVTRGLLSGSTAIDQIPPALCRDPFGTAPVPDQRGVPRPVGALCDMGAFEGTALSALYFHNLLRNGDAESSAGSPNGAYVGLPVWTILVPSQMTVVSYGAPGGFPIPGTDPVPFDHGDNFFAGGFITTSVGWQIVDFSGAGTNSAIDAGQVDYVLSADLGGYQSQNDRASVTVQFENQFGIAVGAPVTLTGPTAAGRGNLTGMLPIVQTGVLSATMRAALVTVTMARAPGPGSYNDGYADNISLVLLPAFALRLPMIRR